MKPAAFEQFASLERSHWWFRGRRRVYLELLRGALEEGRPARVLDVGAGVGGFLRELNEVGDELVYTELDAAALELCRARGVGRGLRSSADQLPFRDESFDLICLFDVIEHVADDRAVLAEALRLLRPEGHLLVSVPAHAWLFSRNDEVAGHQRRYGRGDLRRLFDRPELALVRCTYANALLFPAIAGFVLAAKGLGALGFGSRDGQRTNLSWKLPAPLEALCYRAFAAELLVSRRWDLPLGHSLVAIAQRKQFGGRLVTLRPQRPAETRTRRAQVSPTAFAAD